MIASIRFRNVTKRFCTAVSDITPVDSVSLTLEPGKITALMGRSGCGKTTFLKLASGLLSPDKGTISVSPSCARRAVVFQDPRLLPWKNVEDNVSLALLKEAPETRLSKTRKALAFVGLENKARSYPTELSGGQAQRVALARALCVSPDILLLDEPFASLDALTRVELQKECTELLMKTGLTVFLITHDPAEALTLSDRILIQSEGKIVYDIPVTLTRPRDAGSEAFRDLETEILGKLLELPA